MSPLLLKIKLYIVKYIFILQNWSNEFAIKIAMCQSSKFVKVPFTLKKDAQKSHNISKYM
jgi:hypothetical protein